MFSLFVVVQYDNGDNDPCRPSNGSHDCCSLDICLRRRIKRWASEFQWVVLYFPHEEPVCRICHDTESEGTELVSPCNCRGTVAFTHVCCLEQWLSQSGSTACELCGHTFNVRRMPRYSSFLWTIFLDFAPCTGRAWWSTTNIIVREDPEQMKQFRIGDFIEKEEGYSMLMRDKSRTLRLASKYKRQLKM